MPKAERLTEVDNPPSPRNPIPEDYQIPPGEITDEELHEDELAAVQVADRITIGIDLPRSLQDDIQDAFPVAGGKKDNQQKVVDDKEKAGIIKKVKRVSLERLYQNFLESNDFLLTAATVKFKHRGSRLYLTFSREGSPVDLSGRMAVQIEHLFKGGYQKAKLSEIRVGGDQQFVIINVYDFLENPVFKPNYYFSLKNDKRLRIKSGS